MADKGRGTAQGGMRPEQTAVMHEAVPSEVHHGLIDDLELLPPFPSLVIISTQSLQFCLSRFAMHEKQSSKEEDQPFSKHQSLSWH